MNTRHFVLSVIGFGVLAGGCSSDLHPDQQARRRFEVSPSPGDEINGDPYVTRRSLSSGYAESPVSAVERHVRSATETMADAPEVRLSQPESPPIITTPPAVSIAPPAGASAAPAGTASLIPRAPSSAAPTEAARPTAAPAQRAAVDPDEPRFDTPDRQVPPGPRHPRVAPPQPAAIPAIAPAVPGGDEARPPAEPNVGAANQGSQIAHATASPPAPAAPVAEHAVAHVPASPRADGPAIASLNDRLSATAETDPDQLLHKFDQHVREEPADLAAHLDLQMLRFLREEQVPQLDTISTLPEEDRELLTGIMDGLVYFRSGLKTNKNMLLSQKVKPILAMSDRIRSQAELTIPTLTLCSRVQGFSVYEPMSTTLRSGVANTVIIYCEVENFSSKQDDRGMWETKLSQDAVLYNETGLVAWRDKSDVPVDLSHSRRHDFFLVKKVTLPRTLAIGRYNLKVSVMDEQTHPNHVAENDIPIEVMAQ